jgi:hypothetical protein
MDLDQFIKEALINIVSGIEEAQKIVVSQNAFINPFGIQYNLNDTKGEGISLEGHKTSTIEFELSVMVEESSAAQGKIGIKAGLFNVGAGGDLKNSNNSINKIKFSIPVLFPFQDFKSKKQ